MEREQVKRFWAVITAACIGGCVSINDNTVQVTPPGQADQYQRNVLDKCPPHINPHRLILAQIVTGSSLVTTGSQVVTNQQDFDNWWSQMAPQVTSNNIPTYSLSQAPMIDWTQQQVYFLMVPIDTTCQKTVPYGDEMISDCYDITVPLYRTTETQNCVPAGYYPVFVFIYAKTNLPLSIQWINPTPTPTTSPLPTSTSTPTPTATPQGTDQ